MSKNQTIRFAVMIDSYTLKNWQIRCIEVLLENPLNQLVLFIKNDSPSNYKPNKLPIGFRFIEKQLRKEWLFQSSSIENKFGQIKTLDCKAIQKKSANELEQADLEIIKNHQLDFILRFGFGIIKGEILNIPKYGIWSFHHGNPRKYRGGPPSFWEFLHREYTNGIILQKLGSQLDAGEILREGNIAIWAHSFNQHSLRLFEYGIHFPNYVCNSIRIKNGKLKSWPISDKGPIYKVPNNLQVIRFYWRALMGKLNFHFIQLFQGEIWNMGIAHQIEENKHRKEVKNINWAPEDKNHIYKADPFWGEGNRIYFENYDYQKLRGDLNSIEFIDGKWTNEKVFRQDLTHYSYPYYIEEAGKRYILPENFQSGQLQLHELYQGEIIASKTILEGKWIDPTLIKHQNKWWLFVTPQVQSNEALHIYFADQIDGNYQAHPLNPVKIDICSARPGGTPYTDPKGRLIRPSQNSAKTYGASIVLNEIVTITELEYEERKLDEIFPDSNSKYNQALHTFTYNGDLILIDGKRITFIFSSFWSQLKRKFKRVLGV